MLFPFRSAFDCLSAALLALSLVLPCRSAQAEEAEENGADEGDADEGLTLQGARQITFETTEGTWLSLDVSPDGQQIVFELLGDLYLLPIEGGAAAASSPPAWPFDSQPRFSPDGERIVFVSDRDGTDNVWTIARDGSDPQQLTSETGKFMFVSPEFAPDGSHVIVAKTSWGMRTHELWAYHVDGGKGIRMTVAAASADTPTSQRSNSLGAVYSPDGRYLYFARKFGGFAYNIQFPQWQIVRRDLRTGEEDYLTQAQGSAFRPRLSPDGRLLVYGTRYEQQTGLRVRNLETGEDSWLAYPVEHDEQESRFTRDLLPGYAFTPDGSAILLNVDGGIRRLELASGEMSPVAFHCRGGSVPRPPALLSVPPRPGPGESPHAHGPRAVTGWQPARVLQLLSGPRVRPGQRRHPHPDARWAGGGGWSSVSSGLVAGRQGARLRELVQQRRPPVARSCQRARQAGAGVRAAELLLGAGLGTGWASGSWRLRAASYDRLYKENDWGWTIGSDLIWFDRRGGEATLIAPSRGFQRPHFGPESDRIYLYNWNTGLSSMRFDGTDRRDHLAVSGAGILLTDEEASADDVRLSPDGTHALAQHASQLYLIRLLNPNLSDLSLSLANANLPMARITDIGADFFGWSEGGQIDFLDGGQPALPEATRLGGLPGGRGRRRIRGRSGSGVEGRCRGGEEEEIAETHEAVRSHPIALYRPRHEPVGTLVLQGATVLSMEEGAEAIADATVVVVEQPHRIRQQRAGGSARRVQRWWTSAAPTCCLALSTPMPIIAC